MIRTVAVFVFVSLACVATAFSQTIEKGNKMDVQKKNSSAEVSGHQLPEAKIIEPKLPDIEAKKLATDDKSMQTYGLTPSSPASGLSPYFYDFPALLESNPALTDFYNFRQHSMNGQFSFIGSAEQKTYLGLGQYVAVNAGMRWIPSQRFFVEAGGTLSRQFYLALPIARQDIAGIYENALFFSQKCPVKCLGTIFYGGKYTSSGLQSVISTYRGRSFYLGRCEKEYGSKCRCGIPVRQEFKGMENGNVRPCIHWLLTHISSFIWFCYLFPISLTH